MTLEGTCRPTTCGSSTDWMNYTYDLAGNMLSSSDGNKVTTTYTYTPANELKTVTSSNSDALDPAALLSNVQQSVVGPTSFQLGNGLQGVNSYDTMGRWNGRWVCNGSTSANCSGGTQLDGSNVTWKGTRANAMTDTSANKAYTYGYDDLSRLKSTSVGGTQTYSYSYDLFGNRLSQTPGPSISFNASNNQMTGFQYDAGGNLLKDAAGNQYTYDAAGNVVQVVGTSSGTLKYTYDELNHRVRVDKGSTYQEYDFNVAGQGVSIWNGTTNLQGQYYAGNRPLAYYKNGATHFQHQDWLGSERIRTTYNGAVEGKFTQLAFGDGYQLVSGSDTDDAHYASLDYDAPTQTSHAQFRELDTIHGRWMSPDPYNGSYDARNPQSFNRYSYALNNPLSLVDPSGLDSDCDDGACPGSWACEEYGYCGPDPIGCQPGDDVCVTGNPPPNPNPDPGSCDTSDCSGGSSGSGGGGGGSTGGGGGGTSTGAAPGSSKATAQCAAAHASSFASLLGISNRNVLGQTLLGNDISTISNLITGPGQGSAGVQVVVSNPTPANALYQLGKRIGATQSSQFALVQTASQNAFGTPQYYARALSLAETAGGKALSEAFAAFSGAKLAYDTGAYALAYAQCSAGVIH